MMSDDLLLQVSANTTNYSAETNPEEDADFEARMLYLQWVAYGIVAPILIASGIVGNLLNLLVLTRPSLRGVMYTYLTWLAISDLMSLVFTIPTLLRFTGCARDDYYSAWYHAHVELALVNAFMACSVFIVVAVTVDRFFSVSRPTKYKAVHTPNRARLWIGCSYTGAFLLYIPVCFFKEVHEGEGGRYVVRENFQVTRNNFWTAYLWFKEILVRLGPSLVLACLNILIIVAFQRVVRRRKALLNASRCTYAAAAAHGRPSTAGGGSGEGGNSGGGSGTFQEERRLVMLLISIVVMFVVTMTPQAFLTVFLSYEKERNFHFQVFRAFANNMEFVNYAMNFYLYCLCSSEIRSTFLSMFHFLKMTTSSLGRHSTSDDTRPPVHGGNGSTPPCSKTNLQEQATTSVFVDSKI